MCELGCIFVNNDDDDDDINWNFFVIIEVWYIYITNKIYHTSYNIKNYQISK